MSPRQNGQRIGADFIGRVSVGRDAVGADNDLADFSLTHQRSRHVVANQRGGNFFLLHFPGGKPCPLQNRTRFIHIHMQLLSFVHGRAEHTQRSAVAGRRQRARVAVREDMVPVGEKRRAAAAHLPVDGNVLGADALRLPDQLAGRISLSRTDDFVQMLFHPLQRPEKIAGRGPGGRDFIAERVEFFCEFFDRFRRKRKRAQRRAHGGRHADGRRAAHRQIPDGGNHLPVVGADHLPLHKRQSVLVDQDHRVFFPENRFNQCHPEPVEGPAFS